MLATLRKLPPRSRTPFLVDFIQSLLPISGTADVREISDQERMVFEGLKKDLLKELRLSSLDSSNAKTRAFNFLSKQISDQLIPSNQIKEVRARVGQKGVIPVNLYDLKFAESFLQCEKAGFTKSFVKLALKSPDSVHHFEEASKNGSITLTTTTFRGDDPFVVVVFAFRSRSVLSIQYAWAIYHSDVQLSGSRDGLDILGRFADVFGQDIEVDNQKTRFVANWKISTLPGQKVETIVRMPGVADGGVLEHHVLVSQERSWLNVEFAMCVNFVAYKASLEKHGFKESVPVLLELDSRPESEQTFG